MVGRNKRYIVWFWLLNLLLAQLGTSAFTSSAHNILGHSLASDSLVHGFDIATLAEMITRPEFGQTAALGAAATSLIFVFFLATALFLPGVFQGYAATYRLPREDFFRACGRNLWRYIRLLFIAGIVMGLATGALFGIHGVLERKAAESTNELLLPEVRFIGLGVIFLIMTCFRIWFDLAEADLVLNDQRAVRKSIAAALRQTLNAFVRLLSSYVVTAIFAVLILLAGIYTWMHFIKPESTGAAFLISQFTLLLLLIPRFWQRGIIVAYWKQNMMIPVVTTAPVLPQPIVPLPIIQPVPAAAPEPPLA